MRRRALLACVPLLAARLHAGAGEEGFRFLNAPLSPRAAAMGGAAVAVADDAAAAAWNPAAWGEVRRGELFLSDARLADGAGLTGLSLAWPVSRGALGLEARTLDYGDIPGYDGGGFKAPSVEARDTALSVAYGRPWGRAWTVGASVKQAEQKVAGLSGRTLAADAGALWRPFRTGGLRSLRFGASLRQVGAGAAIGSQKTSLPRAWSLGAAYQTFAQGWITALSLDRAGAEEASFRAGQEVWLGSLALRAGYQRASGFSDGYTLGAGFRVADFQVDYAFAGQGKGYEDAHRVGVTWRFGGPTEALYQQGLRLLREARYGEAVLKFNEVLEVQPRHRRAIERLREAADFLRREPGGEDEKK